MRQRNRVLIMAVRTWLIMGTAMLTNLWQRRSPLIITGSGSICTTHGDGKGSGGCSWPRNPGAQIVCAQTSMYLPLMWITKIHTAEIRSSFFEDHSNPSATAATPERQQRKATIGGGVVKKFSPGERRACGASHTRKIPNVRNSGLSSYAN